MWSSIAYRHLSTYLVLVSIVLYRNFRVIVLKQVMGVSLVPKNVLAAWRAPARVRSGAPPHPINKHRSVSKNKTQDKLVTGEQQQKWWQCKYMCAGGPPSSVLVSRARRTNILGRSAKQTECSQSVCDGRTGLKRGPRPPCGVGGRL